MKQIQPPSKKTDMSSAGVKPVSGLGRGRFRNRSAEVVATGAGHGFGFAAVFSRLTPAEWQRRLMHMSPGLLPFVLWLIPHRDPLSWDCTAWLASVIVGLGLLTAHRHRRIARPGEEFKADMILGYTVPILLMLILFPGQPEIGLSVLAVLSIGDGSATLGGLLLRGPRLPWNSEKTWAGSLCFVICAAPFTSLIYWGEAHPSVSVASAGLCGGTAALAAALSESLRSRINDNVRVGATASITLVAMNVFVVGWS